MKKQEFFNELNRIKGELAEAYEEKKKICENHSFSSAAYFAIKGTIKYLKDQKTALKIRYNESRGESISIGHFPVEEIAVKVKTEKNYNKSEYLKEKWKK